MEIPISKWRSKPDMLGISPDQRANTVDSTQDVLGTVGIRKPHKAFAVHPKTSAGNRGNTGLI
jgi:hypothetical protein